jgi:hypothetical protein
LRVEAIAADVFKPARHNACDFAVNHQRQHIS